MNWHPLIAEQQLVDIDALSEKGDVKAVVILKHSTRCSISGMALNRLERAWKFSDADVHAYYLDLLSYRNVSDKIASAYSIPHESPQLLVIKNGKCIYSASHSGISVAELEEVINS